MRLIIVKQETEILAVLETIQKTIMKAMMKALILMKVMMKVQVILMTGL